MKPGYASINGLNMYYEVEGAGETLVYVPPALSCAGLNSFPSLAKKFSVLTPDLQGHGRTADIPDRSLSLEQHAEDVAALLKHLGISKAHFFGESFGGGIATLIALRYPQLVGRVATYGATFGPAQDALNMEMLQSPHLPTADSKAFAYQKEYYKKVAPHPEYWPRFWEKVSHLQWHGFTKEQLSQIRAPLLIALGDHDFVRLEHAVTTYKLIPHAELAVIPDAGHFALFSQPGKIIPIVDQFLNKDAAQVPIGTGETGYSPGESR